MQINRQTVTMHTIHPQTHDLITNGRTYCSMQKLSLFADVTQMHDKIAREYHDMYLHFIARTDADCQ